jgi:acetyl-CoA/propionyl-CoA carboxylase, biotin carboxylase, biotin carboxyl carrier protein
VKSLVGFHRALLEQPCFIAAQTCRGVVESKELAERAEQLSHLTTSLQSNADGSRPPPSGAVGGRQHVLVAEVDGRRFEVRVVAPEPEHAELARRRRERGSESAHHGVARDAVVSPMQGTVLSVEVADGDQVEPGQVVCVVEAMKMENEITAPRSGIVSSLSVAVGEPVTSGQVICVLSQEADDET